MKEIRVQNLVLGMLATNCWFLQNPETKELLIVDPAASPERIFQQVTAMEGKPAAVLLTHGHYDHMLAAEAVRDAYEIPVYAHEAEQEVLGDAQKNLSAVWSAPYTMQADRTVKEGKATSSHWQAMRSGYFIRPAIRKGASVIIFQRNGC